MVEAAGSLQRHADQERHPLPRANPIAPSERSPLNELVVGHERLEHLEAFGRPYILPNYKAVLSALEEAHKVTCEPVAANRPIKKGKRSFADGVYVTFPANS
jgi:hypothetical protein